MYVTRPTGVSRRIAVRDTGTSKPVLRSPSPDDAFGRGLRIVAELADDWGIESTAKAGNTVWFVVGLEPADVTSERGAIAGGRKRATVGTRGLEELQRGTPGRSIQGQTMSD